MITTIHITEKTGYTRPRLFLSSKAKDDNWNLVAGGGYTRIRPFPSSKGARTFQDDRFRLDKAAAVAEAEHIVRENAIRSHYTFLLGRVSDQEEVEEREWEAIVSKPHVLVALRRMAAEARNEYYAGETKEGGFAIE